MQVISVCRKNINPKEIKNILYKIHTLLYYS